MALRAYVILVLTFQNRVQPQKFIPCMYFRNFIVNGFENIEEKTVFRVPHSKGHWEGTHGRILAEAPNRICFIINSKTISTSSHGPTKLCRDSPMLCGSTEKCLKPKRSNETQSLTSYASVTSRPTSVSCSIVCVARVLHLPSSSNEDEEEQEEEEEREQEQEEREEFDGYNSDE
ncbi:hypothetical protein NQ317_017714 [Molorchus minor]|uniref:Uncharacterized protein n=1 Tax=Molorchus minor TaxID=1323400 RepID=A0ABQ9JG91_9CUCU|nr:hypothetical protein NQ317_017714 [Molorchus minor]